MLEKSYMLDRIVDNLDTLADGHFPTSPHEVEPTAIENILSCVG